MARKQSYCVEWCIDIDAVSPKQAAKEALKIMRDPNSMAVVFGVIEEDSKEIHHIDLMEVEEESENRLDN